MILEIGQIQRKASPCERVIRVAEDFRNGTGRYPRALEMTALEPSLSTACGFRPMQASFSLAVSGHWFNLETYEYDSLRKSWRWE